MTIKQMLLSALILGATSNIALGQNTKEQQKKLNKKFLSAAFHGNSKKVDQLLKDGAEINTKNKLGKTALHRALTIASPTNQSNKEYLEIASKLIEDGIDSDAQDEWGHTAAHEAARNCNYEMLDLLHKNNANLTIKDGVGEIPLNKAREQNSHLKSYDTTDHVYSYAQNKIAHCQTTIAFLEEIEKTQGKQTSWFSRWFW